MLLAVIAERDAALRTAHAENAALGRANADLRAKWREARRVLERSKAAADDAAALAVATSPGEARQPPEERQPSSPPTRESPC